MAWPTKTDFVDGDVLSASQMNNIGTNLNLYNPTSATNGQVPIANGAGSVAFGTLSTDSMTVISSGNLPTGSGTLTLSSIPTTYNSLELYLSDWRMATNGQNIQFRFNNLSTSVYEQGGYYGTTSFTSFLNLNTQFFPFGLTGGSGYDHNTVLRFPNYTGTQPHNVECLYAGYTNTGVPGQANALCMFTSENAITRIDCILTSGNYSQGTYTLYGVK